MTTTNTAETVPAIGEVVTMSFGGGILLVAVIVNTDEADRWIVRPLMPGARVRGPLEVPTSGMRWVYAIEGRDYHPSAVR